MKMITRERALEIIEDHGWGPNDQTAVDIRLPLVPMIDIYGRHIMTSPWVQSGTSFNEHFGIHNEYSQRLVLDWLGY